MMRDGGTGRVMRNGECGADRYDRYAGVLADGLGVGHGFGSACRNERGDVCE